MKCLTVPANTQKLDDVLSFISTELEAQDFPMKVQMQIEIAVEEIFVNIAHYAYTPTVGDVTVCCEIENDPLAVMVQFSDGGRPYNPLEKSDPDTTLSAEERHIGGLGVFMVKKSMDDIRYDYKNERNILTIRKKAN